MRERLRESMALSLDKAVCEAYGKQYAPKLGIPLGRHMCLTDEIRAPHVDYFPFDYGRNKAIVQINYDSATKHVEIYVKGVLSMYDAARGGNQRIQNFVAKLQNVEVVKKSIMRYLLERRFSSRFYVKSAPDPTVGYSICGKVSTQNQLNEVVRIVKAAQEGKR